MRDTTSKQNVVDNATDVNVIDFEGKGYLVYRQGSGNTVEIFEIEVDNEYRRQGVGKTLIKELMCICRQKQVNLIYAFTRSSNSISQEFYLKLGFARVNVPKFYQDEVVLARYDCVLFKKTVA